MKRALLPIAAVVLVAVGALWALVGRHADAPANTPAPERGIGEPRKESGIVQPDVPAAVPPELVAAKRERETVLRALTDSGKTTAPWTNDGNLLLEKLAHDAHAAGWTQAGCFVAGCGGTLLFASDDALTKGRAIAEALDGYRTWTGTKSWSSPERWLDGRVSITLVLGPPR